MAARAVQVTCFKKGVGRGKLFIDRLLARFLQVFFFCFLGSLLSHTWAFQWNKMIANHSLVNDFVTEPAKFSGVRSSNSFSHGSADNEWACQDKSLLGGLSGLLYLSVSLSVLLNPASLDGCRNSSLEWFKRCATWKTSRTPQQSVP